LIVKLVKHKNAWIGCAVAHVASGKLMNVRSVICQDFMTDLTLPFSVS